MFKREGEKRQRFSIRKYSTGVFSAVVGLTFMLHSTATEILADHKVNYNFIDINNLSEAERSLIVSGVPSGKVSSDEEIILVYKQVNGGNIPHIPPTNPENPEKPKTPEDPEKPKTPENPEKPKTPETPKTEEISYIPKKQENNKRVFPKTGSKSNLLVELGLAGATLGAAIYLRKSKKGRHTFFVVTILGTMVLGSHIVVADGYQSLLEQVTKIVQTDAELSQVLTPSEIPNYQYVGYIRRRLPATQKGTVNVHYRDRAGNSLAPMEKAVEDGAVGQPYSTKSLFRQSIEKDGKTYNWVETQGEEEGTLSEGVKNITYIYDENPTPPPVIPPVVKQGSVQVHYRNSAGEELKPSVTAVSNANVGTAYDTSSLRDVTIEKDGKTYHYASTSGTETGSVTEGTTEITYIYDETPTPPPVIPPVVKQGSVQVHYRNSAGEELKPSVTVVSNATIGTAYDTSSLRDVTIEKDGKTYHYASTSGTETGSVTEGTTEITYIYDETPTPPPVIPPVVKQGSVQVHYRNSAGEELKPSVTAVSNANVGTAYDTSSLRDATIEKDGKTYRYVSTSGSESGSIAEGTLEVTYVYEEVVVPPVVEKKGSVRVKFETNSGTSLQTPISLMTDVAVGSNYDARPHRQERLTVGGKTYEYVSTSGAATGKVVEGMTEVTFVYKEVAAPVVEKKGTVRVHYQTAAGDTLKASVTAVSNEKVGTGYNTSILRDATIEKDGKTYRYVSTNGAEQGTVQEGTTEVVYIYEEVTTPPIIERKGSVRVKFESISGEMLQAPEMVLNEVPIDTAYDVRNRRRQTLTVGGKTYRYVSVQGSETGNVVEGVTDVVYLYDEVIGSVIVKYVNEAGQEIKAQVTVKSDEPLGTSYDTRSLRDETLTGTDGKTYRYKSTTGNEQGQVSEGTTTVTYVYEETKGSVVVKYVNEAGQEIKAQATVETDVPLGTVYDTRSLRDETLTGTDGKTYRYKSTTGNEQGQVSEGTTTVTYVYEETKGSVLVKYVNEAGQEIKAQVTVKSDEPLGTSYDTRSLRDETLTGTDGKTYRYKSTTGNEQGQVSEGTTTVTYVYEETKGSVVVKYVNEAGQEIKAQATVETDVPLGTVYDTRSLRDETLTGTDGKTYRYKSTTGNEQGQVSEGTTTVTYVYEETKGSVVVKYVNEAGQEIKAQVTVKSDEPLGTSYDTRSLRDETLTGTDGKTYRYKSTTGNEQGQVSEGTTTVTYVYEETKGSVVVKYVNEAGQEIKAQATVETDVPLGTVYDTRSLRDETLDGTDGKTYRYKSTTGNEQGQVSEGTTTVTYVYEETKGSVVVKYVNEAGQEIKAQATVETDVPLGTVYDTRSLRDETLTGTDGKTYRYKSTTGNEQGQVSEGTTTVTYVYEETKGSVLVKYVNESGQEIKAQATVETDVPLGTVYDTRSLRDETLTGTDGKTYRYKSTTGNEQGQVSEGVTEVTYIYEETKGSVLVKYVNEAGDTIHPDETVLTDASVGTQYDTTAHRHATIEHGGKTYEYKSTVDAEIGNVAEGTTVITYVYKEKAQTPSAEEKGTVIVKYVDETGQEIWPSETALTNVPSGTHYDVSDKKLPMITITGPSGRMYRYKSTIGSETGQVGKGTTTIAFVYESPKGSVIVKYVDEAGHTIIPSETAVDNEPVGGYYNISDYLRNTITDNTGRHYQLRSTQDQLMGLMYGVIEEGTKEVSLVYRANQKANQGYLVAVFETRSGKKLRGEMEILPFGDTGRTYDVTMNRFAYQTMTDFQDGNRPYRLVEVVGDEKGTLQEGRHVIRYIYEPMYGNLKVRYISRKTGQELAPSVTLPYNGSIYNTLKYRKDPSEFSTGLSDPATYQTMTVDQPEIGELGSDDLTVTYYYDYDLSGAETTGKHTINYTFNLNTHGFYYSTFKVSYKGQELTTMKLGDEGDYSFVASGKLFYGEGAIGSATQAPTKEEILANLTFEIDGIVLQGFEEFEGFMSEYVEDAPPVDNFANYVPKQTYTGNTTVNLYQILAYSRGKGWG